MSVYHVYAWCPWNPEEGMGTPRIGVNRRLWILELTHSLLQKQQVFTNTEPTLQLLISFYY